MSNNKESSHAAETPVSAHDAQGPGVTPGLGSPGVQRIEALSSHLHILDRVFLFCGIFLIAYFHGLDSLLRGTYQVGLRQHAHRTINAHGPLAIRYGII